MIAKMIDRAWQKRSTYLEKKDSKVICVGLDNAGKTAILSSLGGKLGIKDLQNLKPTKQIERQKITTNDLELHVWDFGGQVEYRQVYLQNPEKFFLRTDLMMYVIDIQDPDRYKDSFAYFKEIIDIMQRLSECPYILVFLHKCDPDILEDPDFQIHLDYAKNKTMEILSDYCMEYDIYITSIYNFFNSEPTFSKYIKEVMGNRISENNPMLMKIEGISEILETTLNAIVNLSSSVGEQLNEIDLRLRKMESDISRIKSEYIVDIPSAPGQKKPVAVPTAENSVYNVRLAKIADDTLRIKDDLENFNKLYQYSEKITSQVPKYQKTQEIQPQKPNQISQQSLPSAKPAELSDSDKQDMARLAILKNLQSLLKKKQ
jgi:small GTP-binding protein